MSLYWESLNLIRLYIEQGPRFRIVQAWEDIDVSNTFISCSAKIV